MKIAQLTVNADSLRIILRDACDEAGGVTAWAAQHDIGQTFVSMVLSGRKLPSPRIAKALGFSVKRVYVREGGASAGG
jgi:hypothetical protein